MPTKVLEEKELLQCVSTAGQKCRHYAALEKSGLLLSIVFIVFEHTGVHFSICSNFKKHNVAHSEK